MTNDISQQGILVDDGPMTTMKYLTQLKQAFSKHFPDRSWGWITDMEDFLEAGEKVQECVAFSREMRRCGDGIVHTIEKGRIVPQSTEQSATSPVVIPALVAAIEPQPAPDGHIPEVDLPPLGQQPDRRFGPQVSPPAEEKVDPNETMEIRQVESVNTVPMEDGPAEAEATRNALTTQEQHAIVFGAAAQVTGTLPFVSTSQGPAAVPESVNQPTQTDAPEPQPADPPATLVEQTGPYHDRDYVPPPVIKPAQPSPIPGLNDLFE